MVSTKTETKTEKQVDEELYSRQLYVIGHDAMRKIMKSKVLIVGMDGLGQEIAKNICLSGVKRVAIFDKSPVSLRDLGSGFYFSKKNLGKAKDESVYPHLARLNRYVTLEIVHEVNLSEWDVVVSANQIVEDNMNMNSITHRNNVKFVMANVSGLFSQLFVDFSNHQCLDKDGQPLSTGSINDITPEGVLTLADGAKHTLSTGDIIKIKDMVYKVKVLSKVQLQLEDYVAEEIRIGGDFEQVKEPINITFAPLSEAVDDESLVFSFDNPTITMFIHRLFMSKPTTDGLENKDDKLSSFYSKMADCFTKTRNCVLAPMCSVVGGFAAQEVMKGITGKFIPLQQFFYFEEASSFLGDVPNCESMDTSSRYDDMLTVFGKGGFEKLMKMNVFLVGAGAIGCENIKNFVMSGIGSQGSIHITDMDSIEASNLNRQFLFHEEDIGKSKSESAVRQARILNEDYAGTLKSYTTPVGEASEDVFTDEFISEMDVISNALDNVEARNYMDGRAVALRRPMVDGGTLGTKGHVQVVVPFKTESYSSTTDAVEASVPMCTIKTFPNTIEHAIAWALEIFKRKFNEEPELIKGCIAGDVVETKVESVEENVAKDALDSENMTPQELVEEAPRTVDGCIKSALDLFVQLFSTSIQHLLSTFPADYVTKEGLPFWTPPKRLPSPVPFNINDRMHILFVETGANLFAQCFNIRKVTRTEVYKYLENLLSLCEPNPITFGDTPVNFTVINQLDFEKDSWHADFIYACANLRARNYKIKEQSKHFIKGVAGKIIPAIATTTAVVSGLATLEIIKSVLLVDSEGLHNKNAFLDLAMPFMALVDCIPPKVNKGTLKDGSTYEYTLWSRLEYQDLPLGELISQVGDRFGVGVSMVTIGSKLVFWDFCNKYDRNLPKRISELSVRKPGQRVQYVDVLLSDEREMEGVAVIFS